MGIPRSTVLSSSVHRTEKVATEHLRNTKPSKTCSCAIAAHMETAPFCSPAHAFCLAPCSGGLKGAISVSELTKIVDLEARDVALGSGGPLISEDGSDGCGEIDADEASQPPRAESPRRQPDCSLLARQGIPFCESHPCGQCMLSLPRECDAVFGHSEEADECRRRSRSLELSVDRINEQAERPVCESLHGLGPWHLRGLTIRISALSVSSGKSILLATNPLPNHSDCTRLAKCSRVGRRTRHTSLSNGPIRLKLGSASFCQLSCMWFRRSWLWPRDQAQGMLALALL